MAKTRKSGRMFRIGRVRGYLRGRTWYLDYSENNHRRRSKVGRDLQQARELAAQLNSQLETGAPSMLSFEPVPIPELRQRWLDHHEHVLRSSVQTIRRYSTATLHLLNFLKTVPHVRTASEFRLRDAETFVRYLRTIEVTPNGHTKAKKRPLLDKGIVFILNSCRSLFNYALKRRHLSPYAPNPFSELSISRIPIENSKPIELLTPDQECKLIEACDTWQFPILATLMLLGMRPGELVHLVIEDLDLTQGWIAIRNKPELGWQIKTRNERDLPLLPELACMLRAVIGTRTGGPVFLRRRVQRHWQNALEGKPCSFEDMKRQLTQEAEQIQQKHGSISRADRLHVAHRIWWSAGALKEDHIRVNFIRVCRKIGRPDLHMPKLLRHGFATSLQEANVDPLIRNQLMGHTTTSSKGSHGLGMTAVYTHTRFTTLREQYEESVRRRPVFLQIVRRVPAGPIREAEGVVPTAPA